MADVANQAGTSESTIKRIEKGDNSYFHSLVMVAAGLGYEFHEVVLRAEGHQNATPAVAKASRRRLSTPEDAAALTGLGLAVERLRRAKNWSREALARHSGLTGNTITGIESGEWEPTWGNMRRIAKSLGINVRYLNSLAIEYAPGTEGDKLRTKEQNARTIDTEALLKKVLEDV